MNENTVRAFTPLFLASCGVVIIAIAVFGKLDAASFSIIVNAASTAIGAAGGASLSQGTQKRVSAENIENIEMDSPNP